MKQTITLLKRALPAFIMACCGPAAVQAQQFSISTPAISTCSGVLEDSGGPSAPYGNNEDFTTTICSDVPGDAISLNWVVFGLSQQLPQPLDRIRIWDGNSVAAPFLGEYTGSQLQGLISSATIYNFSGCLTVQFTSNGGGTGNFAAGITCYTPCERPTAVATMSEPLVPAKVCVGDPIAFDGSASYAAAGFNVVDYNWDFGDGTTVNTPATTHSFSAPGQYVVQLNLVDDNGCVNSNVVDLEVLVSTTPSFAGTVESVETCLGAVVDLTAHVTPTTWTGMPEATYGDGVYLPDDLGIPFNSELTFTQFEPGQTVNVTSDIVSICANMEHSFMGDLVVQVACPNGQTMVMHQQNGGGTYLGGANDGDSDDDPIPGDCWQYCWSPTATLGTWAECASYGSTPNVMPGGTPSSNALIPGTYSSLQPFSNLIGCPLNGTWTFTVTDMWGADNGFLCDWSLNFNPLLIPDTSQFTPVLGSTLDSAGWTGPFLTSNPTNPLIAQATPNAAGTFAYNFWVTDDFGCTYDTTITITIDPQIVLDAGPDFSLCNDSLPMAAAITANAPPATCTWTLAMNDTWGDGWSGGSHVTITVNGVPTNYTLSNGTQQTSNVIVSGGATVSVVYFTGSWDNENSFTLFNDQGGTVYASSSNPSPGNAWSGTAQCGGPPPVTYAWTPTTGLANAASPTSMVWVTQPTWYYLHAYPAGNPDCAVVDSVLVSPPVLPDPGESSSVTICNSYPAFLMTDSLGGTPDLTGAWTTPQGTAGTTFTPANFAPGIYNYIYTVTSAAGCTDTSSLHVTVIPDTDPTCCGIPDAGPDNYSCNLSIALNAIPGNTGVGVWTGPAGAAFADPLSPQTTVTMPAGQGGAHWFYWRENDGAFCNTVDSVRMTFTDSIQMNFATTDAVCFNYCDGTAAVAMAGGNVANGFTYQWSGGMAGASPDSIGGLCAGTYSLTVTDDNGCSATDSLVIQEPVLLQIDSMAATPVTCSGDCDGILFMQDAEAVEYSFNGAQEWGTSTQLAGVCEGVHQLVIRNAAGCIGMSPIVVTGPPPVEAEFAWGPIPATVENPTIYFHPTGSGEQTYYWDIAGLTYSTAMDTSYTFTNAVPGVYPVCLVTYNYNQCADTVCHDVTIEDVLEPYIPNTFTPNGDNMNDGFQMSVNVDGISSFEMLIYDRWGQLVFSTTDPHQPWLGSRNNSGPVLATGVFVYRIRYEVARLQTQREILGYVTLLK